MAVAKIELKHLAIESSAVTHAVDFKRLRETFGHTLDHVLHHGARHAPGGTGKLALILWIDLDCALFHLDVHLLVQDELELALGALHRHGLTIDRGRDACRNRY